MHGTLSGLLLLVFALSPSGALAASCATGSSPAAGFCRAMAAAYHRSGDNICGKTYDMNGDEVAFLDCLETSDNTFDANKATCVTNHATDLSSCEAVAGSCADSCSVGFKSCLKLVKKATRICRRGCAPVYDNPGCAQGCAIPGGAGQGWAGIGDCRSQYLTCLGGC